MFLRTEIEMHVNKRWGHLFEKQINVFSCDICKKEFKRSRNVQNAQFCGRKCFFISAKSGSVKEKRESTNIARYGVKTLSLLKSSNEKMIETRIEKFGTAAPIHHHNETKQKFQQTMNERYGASHPLQAEHCKQKRKASVIEKFGMDPLALPENRLHLSEAGQKGYEALYRKMKSKMLSNPERLLSEWVHTYYGENDVEGQKKVCYDGKKSWLIDLYVKSLDVYIQLDGEFWHGLDKPLNLISDRAKENYLKDRKMDEWFIKNGLRLVRITDKQWLALCERNACNEFAKALGG